MIRAALVPIGICAVLVGCGLSDGTQVSSSSDNSPAVTVATSPDASALEGTWVTEPISLEAIEATLRQHGLGNYLKRFRPLSPVREGDVLILEIDEATWDLYGQSGGAEPEEIDWGKEYEVEGDTVIATHEGDSNVYRWAVDGDALTLEWLDTTYGDYKGIPEEVFQRVLYMTEAFTRQE